MLDLSREADALAFEEAAQYALTMQGMNFCLVMRNEDDTLSVYPRPNQPCQGGEMRKYKTTHGERCTRPYDPRPGDLRMPFPDGIVEACSKHFSYPRSVEFLRTIFTSGPYMRAVKDIESVHFVGVEDGKAKGIVFTNTSVDPTLFVNMLQFINTFQDSYFDQLVAGGLTKEEAVIAMYLGILQFSDTGLTAVPVCNNYYFSTTVSLPRLLRGEFNDLSGGTWRDGYDYNRPDVQDLYKAREDEVGTNLAKYLRPHFTSRLLPSPYYKGQTYNSLFLSFADFIPLFRELLTTAVEERLAA